MHVRKETRKVDAAGLIRVDGNAYLLPRELAQKEVQLLVDDVSIVVTRKARVIAELDKVDSVYKPRVQKEILRPEKLTHLPQIPDPLYCYNNEFFRLLKPCFTHIETAAFARIETHVYGAVPAKVECNGAD